VNLPQFAEIAKKKDGTIKPVMILTTDGGPDENPRYQKVILHAIANFKKFNLDAMLVATNAPGRSAFNRVERRMAPLSKELAGVILQHDHFGTHLDDQGRTIDYDLEEKNFRFAGETLAKIWADGILLDEHPVIAEYRERGNELPLPDPKIEMEPKWYAEHVRESRYLLQIVKCGNSSCCSNWRSLWNQLVPGRFLPGPVPMRNTGENQEQREAAVEASSEYHHTMYLPIMGNLTVGRALIRRRMVEEFCGNCPYDLFCPSQSLDVLKRTCLAQ
jgi:hypothetical protein